MATRAKSKGDDDDHLLLQTLAAVVAELESTSLEAMAEQMGHLQNRLSQVEHRLAELESRVHEDVD